MIKNSYSIHPDDWSDAYMLRYQPGAMGDFLSCLFLYYFYNAKKIITPMNGFADTFNYDIVNQKWYSADSGNFRLRSFFRHKQAQFHLDQTTGKKYLRLQNNLYKNIDLDNIGDFNINDLVYKLLDVEQLRHQKNTELPYLFSIEGTQLFKFDNFKLKDTSLALPGINLIELTGHRKEYAFIAWLLLAYKQSKLDPRWCYIQSEEQLMQVRGVFTETLRQYGNGNYFLLPGGSEVSNYGTCSKIDFLKIIYENDTQGLEFIDVNDPVTKRMIETSRRDADEILNYFGVDYYNIKPLAEYDKNYMLNQWLKLLKYDENVFKDGILIST